MKVCSKCKIEKDAALFNISRTHSQGLFSWCRECYCAWKRNHSYLRRYGITRKKYEEMCENQEHRCKICRQETDVLHLDHDHRTEQIRGLLCFVCNTGLGSFRDDRNLLLGAVEYLDAAPKEINLGRFLDKL